MTRLLLAGGATVILMAVGLIFPAVVEYLTHAAISNTGVAVVSLAGVLIAGGLVAIGLGFRWWNGITMPAPVRAMVTGNTLFLAFCELETSDRLLRQQGRIFYWTTVLLVPALLLHCGLIGARRWAWWTARGVTAIFVLWFVGFMALIPFADLRGNDGPTPWWGRLYMEGVTLVFASISAYVFRALGSAEAREYFGMSRRDEVSNETVSSRLDNQANPI